MSTVVNSVTFNKGQGGLGRPLPGQDYVSGLLYYTANGNLPTGFTTAARIKQLFQPSDAIAAGINNDYRDETKAQAVYTLTAIGATGDNIDLVVTEPEGVEVDLVTTPGALVAGYLQKSTDTTITLLAASIAKAINALTYIHGYTATSAVGAVTINARPGLGIFLNTGTPLVVTITPEGSDMEGSITTAFAGGIASLQAVWYYHISEFFRMQPGGNLYVGFFPVAYTYVETVAMQTFAKGSIRQFGIYKDGTAYNVSDMTAIQNAVAVLDTKKTGVSVILGADISAVEDLSTLATLATLNAPKASITIAQDGGAQGNALWHAYGKSITNVGAVLGAIALAAVNEDIGWVGKFNFSNGTELDTIAFANGVKFTDPSISDALITQLNLLRYIFLTPVNADVAGSFVNDSHTATPLNSDYAYIENNRTIDKAIRGINTFMVPLLKSPLLLNSDDTLQDTTIAYFIGQAERATLQMQKAQEVSAQAVTIDPTQNVATSSEVVVAVQLVPIGVARNITVNIGFTASIS